MESHLVIRYDSCCDIERMLMQDKKKAIRAVMLSPQDAASLSIHLSVGVEKVPLSFEPMV